MAGHGPAKKSELQRHTLIQVEVANALHWRVMRNELGMEVASYLMENLLSSGIELYETPLLHNRALELASQLRLGAVCDVHCLALAESLECELWTADQKFIKVASPTFQNIHWIGEFNVS